MLFPALFVQKLFRNDYDWCYLFALGPLILQPNDFCYVLGLTCQRQI
jgi:hypothetical protein